MPEFEKVGGVERPSATVPDWSRESPAKFWDPSRKLIRTIRRFNEWNDRPGVFAKIVREYYVVKYHFWSVVTGSEISLESKNLGGGFMMPHPKGCLLGARRSSIGPNLWVGAGVKVVNKDLVPDVANRQFHTKIGGSVIIGTGAIVLGPINIGDYAVIGAGAVVIDDVPPKHFAVGNPARNIPIEPDSSNV